MANPLTPLSQADINLKTPSTATRNFEQRSIDRQLNAISDTPSKTNNYTDDMFDASYQDDGDGPPSSPFIADPVQRKSMSPVKNRSPMKNQPPKRAEIRQENQSYVAQEPDLHENEGLTRAIDLLEADDSVIHHDLGDADGNTANLGDESGYAGMDDTAFSTFSAIPNTDMTHFARLGQNREKETSPSHATPRSRQGQNVGRSLKGNVTGIIADRCQDATPKRRGEAGTPRTRDRYDADDSVSFSPTPRRQRQSEEDNDTTNLILDFTEQFNALAGSSTSYTHTSSVRRAPHSPMRGQTQPDLASAVKRARTPSPAKRPLPPGTPSERMTLLDFEITPAPTPRSLPSITARELESLKSDYLSQVSGLKASLLGKEIEIKSLREAVEEANARVGSAREEVRLERGAKENLEGEREEWRKRGKEMETVMRNVKDEIMRREKEQDNLAEKLEESERKREEAEMKAAEAESRLKAIRTGSSSSTSQSQNGGNSSGVDAAIEQVAMDLHASYKRKHENKVAALKRSYEKRWEKRVKELETKVDEINRENEELRVGKDLTMSGVVPGALSTADAEAQSKARAEEARRLEEHKARALGLAEEVASVKRDNERLIEELEKERIEKGDMVAAVEEMLSLQAGAGAADGSTSSGLENLRGSISRASGMRPPGFASAAVGSGESRIGRISQPGGQGLSRSRSGSGMGGARSGGIMGNIERMGRGRGE